MNKPKDKWLDGIVAGPGEIKVENNIPIPPKNRATKHRMPPFESLKVGQSFFVPDVTTQTICGCIQHRALVARIRMMTRTVTEDGIKGVRVWRIE